jgi:hypothetical protein
MARPASWFQKAAGTGSCEAEETAQGQDISCNGRGRQGGGEVLDCGNLSVGYFILAPCLKLMT